MQTARSDLYTEYFDMCHRPLENRDGEWKAVVSYLQSRFISSDAAILELGAGYCAFIN
jgi:hypothetical protein